MIKFIVKRDGTTQPFEASKVNGWGAWAASNLGGFVDWPSVVMEASAECPEVCGSQALQEKMIQKCLEQNTWAGNRMAGRLYVPYMRKQILGTNVLPTVQEIHARLMANGFMVDLGYSEQEYAAVEKFINHDRDLSYAHFQLVQIRKKYSLRDRAGGKGEFELPQFVYMRMAMALAYDEPKADRLTHVKKWYDHFSLNRINAPTPNFVNLGTRLRSYVSCCLYSTLDEEDSLEVGDHIARAMTARSAGIGGILHTRSLGDAVRGGLITHYGKQPYYEALSGAVNSSVQAGRGGACTTYFSIYDPEAMTLMRLRHPMSPDDQRVPNIDYAVIANKHILRKARRNEQVFTFNVYTAPDLYAALFSNIPNEFEQVYQKYETDPDFVKNWVSARDLCVSVINIRYETGRLYLMMADAVNMHTPFLDPIVSSNLCLEVALPTEGYKHITHLYSDKAVGYINFRTEETVGCEATEQANRRSAPDYVEINRGGKALVIAAQHLMVGDIITDNQNEYGDYYDTHVSSIDSVYKEPEVALCSLAALVPSNIANDDQYADAAYYALKMIDKCIHLSEYPISHIGYTAKSRLNAGVGVTGLAHYLARKRVKYGTPEGRIEHHRLAERHTYFLLEASLRLGKELGNAPWMHRTKWPEGWLPIDTYERRVDELGDFELHYDWENLRGRIVENKGLRFSAHVNHMPTESSSKASGGPNALYPVRDLILGKTDAGNTLEWATTDAEKLKRWYTIAWDVPELEMVKDYAVWQKFADQSISADFWRRLQDDDKVTDAEMLDFYTAMAQYGVKTAYYQNSKTSRRVTSEDGEIRMIEEVLERGESSCISGGCDV